MAARDDVDRRIAAAIVEGDRLRRCATGYARTDGVAARAGIGESTAADGQSGHVLIHHTASVVGHGVVEGRDVTCVTRLAEARSGVGPGTGTVPESPPQPVPLPCSPTSCWCRCRSSRHRCPEASRRRTRRG